MVCRQICSARSIGSTVALTSETRKRSSNAAISSVVAILAIGMAAHTYGDVGYADTRSSQWHRRHDVCYLACRSWSNGLLPPKFFKQPTADNAELLALSRPRNSYPGSAMAIMMRWRVPPPRKFAPCGIRVSQLDERLARLPSGYLDRRRANDRPRCDDPGGRLAAKIRVANDARQTWWVQSPLRQDATRRPDAGCRRCGKLALSQQQRGLAPSPVTSLTLTSCLFKHAGPKDSPCYLGR